MVSFVHQGQFSFSFPFSPFGKDTWHESFYPFTEPNVVDRIQIDSSILTPSFHFIHRHQMPGLLQVCDA